MTELVQSTKINYYKILGLESSATTQQICKAYIYFLLKVIVKSLSDITPVFNIKIKTKNITLFVKLHKHLTFFMTVIRKSLTQSKSAQYMTSMVIRFLSKGLQKMGKLSESISLQPIQKKCLKNSSVQIMCMIIYWI